MDRAQGKGISFVNSLRSHVSFGSDAIKSGGLMDMRVHLL